MELASYSKVFVAGHRGLVGSAICRELSQRGFSKIVVRTHAELDLTNQANVLNFFESERPRRGDLSRCQSGRHRGELHLPS